MVPDPRRGRRICLCSPECNKRRSSRTRRRHYARADPEYMAGSASESSSSAGSDDSQSEDETSESKHAENSESDQILDGSDSHSHSIEPAESPRYREALSRVPSECSEQHEDPMDLDDPLASDPEYNSTGYPGYFNILTPEEEDDEDLGGWRGFDEFQDADTPDPSSEEMIAQLEQMFGPDDDAQLWSMRAATQSSF